MHDRLEKDGYAKRELAVDADGYQVGLQGLLPRAIDLLGQQAGRPPGHPSQILFGLERFVRAFGRHLADAESRPLPARQRPSVHCRRGHPLRQYLGARVQLATQRSITWAGNLHLINGYSMHTVHACRFWPLPRTP